MRRKNHPLAYFTPKTSVPTVDRTPFEFPVVTQKESYFNGTRQPIVIVSRAGIRSLLPSVRGGDGKFRVVQEKEFQNSVILDNTDLSSDCGMQTSELSKRIIEALGIIRNPVPLRAALEQRVQLEHELTLADLQANNGSVYIPELDIVVSTLAIEHVPSHPYSRVGMRNRIVTEDPMFSYINGLHYQIRIVDRAGVFGLRYVNLNGEVFKVPVIVEGDYHDGVYVISTHPSDVGHDFNYARADYFRFEEIPEHVAMYQTAAEAASLGDPHALMKRDLDREKHNNSMEEARLRSERQQQDHLHAARTRELEAEREKAKHRLLEMEEKLQERDAILKDQEREFKIRKEALDRDSLFAKHQTEMQGMNRKALLETLKFGPAVVVGVFAIYKAVQKIREKK